MSGGIKKLVLATGRARVERVSEWYVARRTNELAYSYFATGATAVGAALAVGIAISRSQIEPFYLVICILLFFLTGIGVSLGFHRYFSHKSFEAARWFLVFLAVAGIASGEGYFFRWIYDHRMHHTFSDRPGDPHSPYWYGTRQLHGWRGFLHAHMLWLLRPRRPLQGYLIADMVSDATYVALDKWSPAITAMGIVLPGLFALVCVEARPFAFLNGCLWGGFVRMFVLNHIVWSVNSFGHLFGTTIEGLRSQARNNLTLGILAFGDGWHANHHERPTIARHGFGAAQPDANYLILVVLRRLRIVWQVNI